MVSRRGFLAGSAVGCVGAISGCTTGVLEAETETPTETETEHNPELVGTVVGNYKSGHMIIDSTMDLIGTALDSMSNGDYGLAVAALDGTDQSLSTAEEAFGEAADGAEELEDTEVMRSAIDGEAAASSLKKSCEKTKEAAMSADNGDSNDAQMKLSQSQSHMEEARDSYTGTMTPTEVENRLYQ